MPWPAPPYTGGVLWQDLPSHLTPVNAADLNTEENAEAAYAAQVGQSVVNHFELSPSGGDDTAAITAAIAAGVPLASGTFSTSAALLVGANGRLRGAGGRANTIIKANAAGTFTNGSLNSAPFMVKWNGGDAWAHGVRTTGIKFDTSGIPGLGATWFQEPGENSWFDDLRCDSCAALPRTVTDAQITSGSNIVTFTASTVTEDDVNALVTNANFPANTKIDRINYANPTAYPPQTTATSVTLNNAATGSAANATVVINQGTKPFVFDGGAATGRIGTLNGILNSGTLLWLKHQVSGSWSIDSLTGDSNGGGLLRISRAGNAGDPMSITLGQIKAENSQAGATAAMMDPVVLLDRCDMVSLKINGGNVIPGFNARDVVRIDQPQARPPSITLDLEGADPFNFAYTNIIHDSSSGEVIAAGPASGTLTVNGGVVTGQRYFPHIVWGRDLLTGGGAKLTRYQPHRRPVPMWATPDVLYNSSVWLRQYAATAIGAFQTFNNTNAQNDGAAWQVDLSAGVWKLTVLYSKAANQAIATIDFSTDGGSTFTSIGTIDEYNATAVGAASADFTGLAVPVDGPALVRFRALTRNASNTTGWVIAVSGMEWSRTA